MKTLILPLIALIALSGCLDAAGTGSIAPITVSSGSGGGGPAAVGDSVPMGAVSFFRKLACPTEWKLYEEATGRVIVAASDGLPRGTLIGEPLSSVEERKHVHGISANFDVSQVEFAAVEGGGNDGLTQTGTYVFATNTGPASSGVPYVQLLACKKVAQPNVDSPKLPAKLHLHFDLDVCPSGWKPAATTEGRLVVGLPQDASADGSFGGDPIISPEPRTHAHSFASSLVTESHGVAAASSCCGKFAKNGTYPIAGESTSVAVDIPMIALLHCEKL